MQMHIYKDINTHDSYKMRTELKTKMAKSEYCKVKQWQANKYQYYNFLLDLNLDALHFSL